MAIGHLGRLRKWREAVEVLDGMGKGGDGSDRPDAFAYGAAINACGKAGRPVEVRVITFTNILKSDPHPQDKVPHRSVTLLRIGPIFTVVGVLWRLLRMV